MKLKPLQLGFPSTALMALGTPARLVGPAILLNVQTDNGSHRSQPVFSTNDRAVRFLDGFCGAADKPTPIELGGLQLWEYIGNSIQIKAGYFVVDPRPDSRFQVCRGFSLVAVAPLAIRISTNDAPDFLPGEGPDLEGEIVVAWGRPWFEPQPHLLK